MYMTYRIVLILMILNKQLFDIKYLRNGKV